MDSITDIVLVGGGLASAKAAQTLREEGFDGRITLFGDEVVRPYERPPLSKDYLLGKAAEPDVYVHPELFYDEQSIDLRLGVAVTEVDRATGQVVTADGHRQRFDRLLLATGAEPRRLPGQQPEGVVELRTKHDSEQLASALRSVGHVTIVGAGWIGCEIAAAARTIGAEVTVIEPLAAPLERVLGTEVGATFARLHAAHGVDLRLGSGLEAIQGEPRVSGVVLSDGTTLETELVVVGIGVVPRTGLAEAAGLEVDNGVLTDATLATSDPRIFAAGDIARSEHPRYGERLRVEHWANALNQGITAGRNLLGRGETYDRLPYFYSDQYDIGLEYVGFAAGWDSVVVRGEPAEGPFLAFWVTGGRVEAAMHVNDWDSTDTLKALVNAPGPVDVERLRDPGTALSDLIGGATG